MQVNFEFHPGQKVVNSLGEEGVVDTAAIEQGGTKKYYLLVKGGRGSWWPEQNLKNAE